MGQGGSLMKLSMMQQLVNKEKLKQVNPVSGESATPNEPAPHLLKCSGAAGW
jgi:hypothetical protein